MKLYRTTKSLVDNETEAEAMELMESKAEIIDGPEAVELIGEAFAQLLENSIWETVAEYLSDWSVSYSQSTIHNRPCVIVSTTETDYIFTDEDDATKMHRKHNRKPTAQEWRRCQTFGKGDAPERPHFNRARLEVDVEGDIRDEAGDILGNTEDN